MCNPIWTLLQPPSTLRVSIKRNGKLAISGSVVTTIAGGMPQKTRIGTSSFPLSLPINGGTTHVVTVRAGSLGEAADLTVTAEVVGSTARGPDVCKLEVDDSHPLAIDIIMAGAM
jgi:hypothetical protein